MARFPLHRFGLLLRTRCPRCYEANMFLEPNPYLLGKLGKMPKRCTACGLDFEPEPGYYFGAMFISYAIAAPACLLFFALLYFLAGLSLDLSLGLVILVQLLFTPYLMHVSRAIWLYFHVRHDPEAANRFAELEPVVKGPVEDVG